MAELKQKFDRVAYMHEYNKMYRAKNRDKILKQKMEYYNENKEELLKKQKEYVSRNIDRKREQDRLWREKNKEKKAIMDRAWRINNRERANANHRRYARTMKGKIGAKKRAAVRRSMMKDLDINVVQMVYEDNIKKYGTLTCYICNEKIVFNNDHLEHRTPLSRGGDNSYSNLAVACSFCNLSKHSMTEQEYREYLNDRSRNPV
jgi:5-methylcytosine-specific restriction endonuclease McrA